MDNLQSITYQTFEQDPVKYRNYEEVGATSRPRLNRLIDQRCKGHLPRSYRVA